jgi:hypothetical protein
LNQARPRNSKFTIRLSLAYAIESRRFFSEPFAIRKNPPFRKPNLLSSCVDLLHKFRRKLWQRSMPGEYLNG